jgi:hypothetical protein
MTAGGRAPLRGRVWPIKLADYFERAEAAHSVAHTEIIRRCEVWEDDVIYRAWDAAPLAVPDR